MASPNGNGSRSESHSAGSSRIFAVLAAVIIGLVVGIAIGRTSTKNDSIDQQVGKSNDHKLTCYYAHSQTTYGTPQESEDIRLLESLGFDVVNPNVPQYQGGKGMEFYLKLASNADVVAFRCLPTGKISPGVSQELGVAKRRIELPSGVEERSYHPQ